MPHRRIVQAFLAELDSAVSNIGKVTKEEMAILLKRSAATIKEYRDEIDFSRVNASDAGWRDVVFELREMAKMIQLFSPAEVAVKLLYAGAIIRSASFLVNETHRG